MKHACSLAFTQPNSWARTPPTGIKLARELAAMLGEGDHVPRLAELSGRSEGYVRWQLSLQTVVPACLLTASLRYCDERLSPSR
jgi:hypothetical protein